jgi:hypothetical protein
VAFLLVTVLAACGTAPSSPGTGSPLLAATATATTITAAPTTAPPSATTPLYVNPEYKFGVALPVPFRKSARLSFSRPDRQNPAAAVAVDGFTSLSEQDEAAVAGQRCEFACPIRNYIAIVEVFTGMSQTPRQWYTSHGGQLGEQIDDTTVDGRTAIRVTNGVPIDIPVQLIVKDGDRIFRVGYDIFPDFWYQMYPDMTVPAGASKEKLDQILASFRFTP